MGPPTIIPRRLVMPKRTVVFVDGQNFKKNLQTFAFRTGSDVRAFRLDEKHFDWGKFFRAMIAKFDAATGVEHQLLRVYWYAADTITPFISEPRRAVDIARDCRLRNPSLSPDDVMGLAEAWYRRERDNFTRAREDVYEQLQRRYDFLEFKFVGQYDVRPFIPYRIQHQPSGAGFWYQGTRQGEKGVDVGIATDMIAKLPNYDVAILVSGDADFVPAVKHVKDHLRWVYRFSVAKGVPPRINYLSPWLRSITDLFGFFDERELLQDYLIRRDDKNRLTMRPDPYIPVAIWGTIDRRLAALAQPQAQAAEPGK